MGKNNPEVGFMTPIKKKSFKSDSSDNQTAQDKALRAKQDLQAAKERESDKSRFIKQVQGAKSDMSAFGSSPYTKSTPGSNDVVNKIMAAKPQKPVQSAVPTPVSSPTMYANKSSFLDKLNEDDRVKANAKYTNTRDFSGDTSLDVKNPKSKSDVSSKAAPKSTPKTKSQFERMQDAYTGFGKGSDTAENKAIQARIEGKGVAKPAAMKKGGKVKAKPMKAFAKGGSVKSSASSRGDGCATKGHTKGRMI